MNRNRGIFITFEGLDGSGKTTQAKILAERLERLGCPVTLTREPGGTSLAENLRRILLNPESRIAALAELFLYEAARAQHIAETILPALKSGRWVLCDRYADASVAYQGYGRGLSLKDVEALNRVACQNVAPDLTIFLDFPLEKGISRARQNVASHPQGDRLEREPAEFHERVRCGYLALVKKFPRRIVRVAAAGSVEEVAEKIRMATESKIRKWI